jgi:enoyl-ACP reductase-like protein
MRTARAANEPNQLFCSDCAVRPLSFCAALEPRHLSPTSGRRGGTAKPIDPEYRLTNQNLTALNGQLHDTRERQRTTSDDLQNILYSIEKVRSAIPRPSWARREFARTRSRLGPRTRAASRIDRFDELLDAAAATAPEHHLVDIDDVGALAVFLVGDGARHITGTIIPVDGGQHLIA